MHLSYSVLWMVCLRTLVVCSLFVLASQAQIPKNYPDPITLIITTDRLANGLFGQDYKQTITVEQGTEPYRWKLLSQLPKGLLFSPEGYIIGRPAEVGQWIVEIQVRDAEGGTGTKQFPFFIGPDPPVITTKGLPDGDLASAYMVQLEALGGVGPLQWSIVKGMLPSGLLLDPAVGTIKGKPEALGTSGFTIQVFDHLQRSDQRTFSVVTQRPPNEILGGLWQFVERFLVRFVAPLLVVIVAPAIMLIGIVWFVMNSGQKWRSIFAAFIPLVISMVTVEFRAEVWELLNHVNWLIGLIVGLVVGFVLMIAIKKVSIWRPTVPIVEFLLSAVFCFFVFSLMVLKESSPFMIFYGITLGAMIHAWILGW